METPHQDHINKAEFDHVYEPAEDSFLLIDALEKEIDFLKLLNPTICLEIGSGSGIVITSLGMVLPYCYYLCTDVNFRACLMSRSTAERNKVQLDCVKMDLGSDFVSNKFDLIVFNPPYVVTDSLECGHFGIEASWAGGRKGREVIDRFLFMVPKILADKGVFYLLVIKENIPSEIVDIMSKCGYKSHVVIERRVRNEHQFVLKFYNE